MSTHTVVNMKDVENVAERLGFEARFPTGPLGLEKSGISYQRLEQSIHNIGRLVLPLGLALFVVRNKTVWDILFAGSVLVTLPVLIVFILFQRQFIRGLALSGLK